MSFGLFAPVGVTWESNREPEFVSEESSVGSDDSEPQMKEEDGERGGVSSQGINTRHSSQACIELAIRISHIKSLQLCSV